MHYNPESQVTSLEKWMGRGGRELGQRRRIAAGLALAVSGLSSLCVAGEPPGSHSPDELVRARVLFQQASDARARGDYGSCATLLREAISLKETPGLRFHLAHCEEKQGHWVEALSQYDRARELIADGVAAPDVEERLAEARLRASANVGTLELRIESVETARLVIDGRLVEAALAKRPIRVEVGSHRVELEAPGYRPYDQRVEVKGGQNVEIQIEPLPLLRPTATPPRPKPLPSSPRSTSQWSPTRQALLATSLGAVLGGVGVGIGFSSIQRSAEEERKEASAEVDAIDDGANACRKPDSPELEAACGALADETRRGNRAATIATMGWAVAGVGVAASLGIWLGWPKEKARDGLMIQPHLGDSSGRAPSGIHVAWSGTF